MSETGTCLLLEGEKVRELLVAMCARHRAQGKALGAEIITKGHAQFKSGDPVTLATAEAAVCATIRHIYRALFGESMPEAVDHE